MLPAANKFSLYNMPPQDAARHIELNLDNGDVIAAVDVAAAYADKPDAARTMTPALIDRLSEAVGKFAWEMVDPHEFADIPAMALTCLSELKRKYAQVGDFEAAVQKRGDTDGIRNDCSHKLASAVTQALQEPFYWDVLPDKGTDLYKEYLSSIDGPADLERFMTWGKRRFAYASTNRLDYAAEIVGINDDIWAQHSVVDAFSNRYHAIEKHAERFAPDLALLTKVAVEHPRLWKEMDQHSLFMAQENVIGLFPEDRLFSPALLARTDRGILFYSFGMEESPELALHYFLSRKYYDFPKFPQAGNVIDLTVEAAKRGWPVKNNLIGIQTVLRQFEDQQSNRYPLQIEAMDSSLAQVPARFALADMKKTAKCLIEPPQRGYNWFKPFAPKGPARGHG